MTATCKPVQQSIIGWYCEGTFPALFTDSVSVAKRWMEMGSKVSAVVRQGELPAPWACAATYAVACDVLAERQRQIAAEGWTPEHDDRYDTGELASAAASYAQCAGLQGEGAVTGNAFKTPYVENWPWSEHWWKPSTDPRRNLIKAGALILAEIERLDRAAIAAQQGKGTAQ